MKRLMLIVVLLSVFVPTTHAQDGESECDVEAAQTALETALDELDGADDPLEVISEARRELARIENGCLGLPHFEGDKDTVEAPYEIDEGIYTVRVESNGFVAIVVRELDGECGPTVGNLIVSLSQGDGSGEALFISEGCTAAFEIRNVSAPYTIIWEKLD